MNGQQRWWITQHEGDTSYTVLDENRLHVAVVACKDDARLIERAPELLDTIKEADALLMEFLDHCTCDPQDMCATCTEAVAWLDRNSKGGAS